MDVSKCRGCGAEIWWIKTKKGKNAPVDIEQTEAPKDDTWMVNQSGQFFKAKKGDLGFMPHFATCPKADNFHDRR